MRTTFNDILDPELCDLPERLNLCRTNEAHQKVIRGYVNRYQLRLLTAGRWWGAYARFHVCSINGCVTMPPQIATVERAAVCGQPVPVHDLWWEFLDNGWGTEGGNGCTSCGGSFGCGCAMGAKYRGNFCTFDDLIGVNKKVRLICDLSSDVGKEVLLLGYDASGNWIRTDQGGTIKDGELVALSQTPGTLSSKFYTSVTDIQAPDDLDGQWWLYEYNNDTTDIRMIGQYQYWERRPSYPRYLFGQICNTSNGDGCNKTLVEVIAKLEFIPVRKNTDYLILGCIPACEYGAEGVKYTMPPSDMAKAMTLLGLAKLELDKELDHYLGAGRRIGMNITPNPYVPSVMQENFL